MDYVRSDGGEMRVSKPFAALIIVSVVNAVLAVPAQAKSSSGTSLSATVTTTGDLLGNYSWEIVKSANPGHKLSAIV